ncbi:MAG: hypothetical protein Q8P18_29855 [Pseudomonadota bacterium]|nr:hypothetical protein [Pseudomonadota bacterium]
MSRPLALLRSVGLLLAVGAATAAPALAHDAHHGVDHNQIDGVRFDIHGNIDGRSVFGAGGRIEFAIVPDGFIGGNVHDELALSFGADLFFVPLYWGDNYYSGSAYVIPIGAVQWNFYLGNHWSVFPEVGVALHIGFDNSGWHDKHGRSYGWLYAEPDLGVGARYHFNDNVALLMRISTPGGIQLGVVF